MNEIIEWLERAAGPDRGIDEMIAREVHGWKPPAGTGSNAGFGFLEYTASIDHALTLVPEGASWTIEPDGAWVRWMGKDDVEEAQGFLPLRGGKCTAIAICVAAFKARMANTPAAGRAA